MHVHVCMWVLAQVRAFFYNDLLMAGQELLQHAKGSFGLVLSHTLDSANSVLVRRLLPSPPHALTARPHAPTRARAHAHQCPHTRPLRVPTAQLLDQPATNH